MRSLINILSKNPENAECKTRLKSLLSKDERTLLSMKMLSMICSEVSNMNVGKYLHLYPNNKGDFIRKLSRKYMLETYEQKEGYLSYKIYSVLNMDKRTYTNRIVTGSDIPSLSRFEFVECIKYLNTYDLVLGPSKDGGFYLVGVRNNVHNIFKNMELNNISTKNILDICANKKISYKLLRVLKDIDTPKDLLNL